MQRRRSIQIVGIGGGDMGSKNKEEKLGKIKKGKEKAWKKDLY